MSRRQPRTLLYLDDESDPDSPTGEAVDDWRGLYTEERILLAWREHQRIVDAGGPLDPEVRDAMLLAADELGEVVREAIERQRLRALPFDQSRYGRREPTVALDEFFHGLLLECSVEEATDAYEGDHPGGSSITEAIYEKRGADALSELDQLLQAKLRDLCAGAEPPDPA